MPCRGLAGGLNLVQSINTPAHHTVKPINIHEAKTHLSRLVERVQTGEEFVIARAGKPVARLVPLATTAATIKTGGLRIAGGVPDDFDTMFGDEIEALFSASGAKPLGKRRSTR
jgi:prevent-host-death family protein